MNCEAVQAYLVDESAPRPADLAAHLEGCGACRDFRRAQATAFALRGASPRLTARLPLARVQRRAGIAAGLALMAFGGVGLARLGASPLPVPLVEALPRGHDGSELARRVDERLLEGAVSVATPEERRSAEAAWRALVSAQRAVAAVSQADPTREDATYRAFGQLPHWLAPVTTQPVRALGRAISPVVRTTEN
jgi:hypothetical protein